MESQKTDQLTSSQPSRAVTPLAHRFISLRVKLILGFTCAFSIVFIGITHWFYSFTINEMISRLKIDMQDTLQGAAKGVDVPELMSLYEDGAVNAEGFSDDPRFHNQLDWLDTIHQTEPQAWLYLFVLGHSSHNRRNGASAVPPDSEEIIYLVDLWVKYDKRKASRFLESDIPNPRARKAMEFRETVLYPRIYTDKWGSWLSATVPLFDQDGNAVALLGLDIEASYIEQMKAKIQNRLFLAFLVSYAIFLSLIYSLSGELTQKLTLLSELVHNTSNGNYKYPSNKDSTDYFPDELNYLSRQFHKMIERVKIREEQIRESKKVEYEVRLALQNEKDINELKSRFISTISHEFRTPLTIIQTSTELLERFDERLPTGKKKDHYRRIKATVENMTDLLDNILVSNRRNSVKLSLKPIAFDINELCKEIIREVKDAYADGHTILFTPIKNCASVFLDRKLLRSMLVNILSNAIKYSASDSQVEFEVLHLITHIQFKIKDYGIGIPLDDQAHLFEAFHRARNTSHVRGTGLGLQIVKHIVELHEGTISFDSREGQGSTFTVQLPLKST